MISLPKCSKLVDRVLVTWLGGNACDTDILSKIRMCSFERRIHVVEALMVGWRVRAWIALEMWIVTLPNFNVRKILIYRDWILSVRHALYYRNSVVVNLNVHILKVKPAFPADPLVSTKHATNQAWCEVSECGSEIVTSVHGFESVCYDFAVEIHYNETSVGCCMTWNQSICHNMKACDVGLRLWSVIVD